VAFAALVLDVAASWLLGASQIAFLRWCSRYVAVPLLAAGLHEARVAAYATCAVLVAVSFGATAARLGPLADLGRGCRPSGSRSYCRGRTRRSG
jgi:hypothetical protein